MCYTVYPTLGWIKRSETLLGIIFKSLRGIRYSAALKWSSIPGVRKTFKCYEGIDGMEGVNSFNFLLNPLLFLKLICCRTAGIKAFYRFSFLMLFSIIPFTLYKENHASQPTWILIRGIGKRMRKNRSKFTYLAEPSLFKAQTNMVGLHNSCIL